MTNKTNHVNHFDKIVAYEDVKIELERILDIMNNPEKYQNLCAHTTKGLLFYGDPGLGKTLFAISFLAACSRKSFAVTS